MNGPAKSQPLGVNPDHLSALGTDGSTHRLYLRHGTFLLAIAYTSNAQWYQPANTRRGPSAFEIPFSSTHPAIIRPQELLYIVNSGLVRLQNCRQDQYIARTERERPYMRGLASVCQSDSLVDAATAAISLIESDVIDCIEANTSI